jgi:quercetin dioxygenase-like cupin family protein
MSTAPKSEVLNVAALADYQTGAVVSRQIVKAEGGNVTLFAFDEGQELSEHTAPFDALVHVLDGEAEIKIAGRTFHLEAGEAILMPADQPHAVRAVKKFKMLLTMIKA